MKFHHRHSLILSIAGVLCLVAGCAEDKKKTHVEEVAGTIERIDHASGMVAVRSYSPKHNKEVVFEVMVTPETELLINGSIATLRDLKIGESASGSVRIIQKEDKTRTINAVKVRVERAEVLKAPPAKSDVSEEKPADDEDAPKTGGDSEDEGSPDNSDDEADPGE